MNERAPVRGTPDEFGFTSQADRRTYLLNAALGITAVGFGLFCIALGLAGGSDLALLPLLVGAALVPIGVLFLLAAWAFRRRLRAWWVLQLLPVVLPLALCYSASRH